MVPWPQNMEVTPLLTKYVHCSEKVLQDAHEGDIDFLSRSRGYVASERGGRMLLVVEERMESHGSGQTGHDVV